MRSIWKGAISFGLVTIPVKLYSATEQRDVAFHQVHREDGGRIKFKRVCTKDGEEVPYSDIAKGYELPSGEIVVLTDEDFANVPLSTSRRIDVLMFAPMEQVDPIYFNKSYYLEPEAKAAKPYALLREALEATDRVAIVKVALRQRESLAVLRVRDRVIMMQTLLWPDEVRAAEFPILEDEVELRPQELRMAASLVESMAADFEPDEFEDDYQKALVQLVDAKLEGAAPAPVEASEESPSEVVDLLSALQASVDRARAARGEAPADKPSAEKAAPKKAPAKKAAAKSTTKARTPGASSGSSTAAKKTPAKTAAKTAKKAPARRSA